MRFDVNLVLPALVLKNGLSPDISRCVVLDTVIRVFQLLVQVREMGHILARQNQAKRGEVTHLANRCNITIVFNDRLLDVHKELGIMRTKLFLQRCNIPWKQRDAKANE